jgi:hypothetical protein
VKRWAGKLLLIDLNRLEGKEIVLKSTHDGILNICGIRIPCVVLEDRTRVLGDSSFLLALGITEFADSSLEIINPELPKFLQSEHLQSFVTLRLIEMLKPIWFLSKEGTERVGYLAEALPEICFVFMDAGNAGTLKYQEKLVAARCREIVRWLAIKGKAALEQEEN